MRINVPVSRQQMAQSKGNLDRLKTGDKIKAKVMEVKGDIVKLELSSGEIVYGKSELPFDLSSEKFFSFVIKGMEAGTLTLAPDYDSIELKDNYFIKDEQAAINKVLDMLGLEKSPENLEIIRNLVKFNMPLDRENVFQSAKYIDKLLSLLNISGQEEIYTFDKSGDYSKQDITKLFKANPDTLDSNLNYNSDNPKEGTNLDRKTGQGLSGGSPKLGEAPLEAGKSQEFIPFNFEAKEANSEKTNNSFNVDSKVTDDEMTRLKNIISALDSDIEESIVGNKKAESVVTNKSVYREITDLIKGDFSEIFPDGKVTDKDIQKIVFLVKSGVEVTVENLKFLNELVGGKNLASGIGDILDTARADGIIQNSDIEMIKSLYEKLDVDFKKYGIRPIREYQDNLNEVLKNLTEKLSTEGDKGDRLLNKVNDFNNKMDMYNKINEKSLFVFIPMTMERENIKDKLYVMSKNRHRDSSETIRAFISLETQNLKKVDVLCDYKYGRLDINFKVDSDQIEKFLRTKDLIRDSLLKLDYSSVNINIKSDIQEDILDMMANENSINYMVDIRV